MFVGRRKHVALKLPEGHSKRHDHSMCLPAPKCGPSGLRIKRLPDGVFWTGATDLPERFQIIGDTGMFPRLANSKNLEYLHGPLFAVITKSLDASEEFAIRCSVKN